VVTVTTYHIREKRSNQNRSQIRFTVWSDNIYATLPAQTFGTKEAAQAWIDQEVAAPKVIHTSDPCKLCGIPMRDGRCGECV
jgi:hypothetical protein